MQKEDKLKRDVRDSSYYKEDVIHEVEHFLERGFTIVNKGMDRKSEMLENERFASDKGYRDPYPSGKPIRAASVFEKRTGVIVDSNKLFESSGKQAFR